MPKAPAGLGSSRGRPVYAILISVGVHTALIAVLALVLSGVARHGGGRS